MIRALRTCFVVLPALACAGILLAGCGGGGGSGGKGPNPSGQTFGKPDLLWPASKLAEEMKSNKNLVILDCRQKESRADGTPFIPYDDEHIKGSYWLDFFVFGDPYPTNQAQIETTLSNLGITVNSTICLYDAGVANPQGKVFFNLERQGCKDVHVLNGGFPLWKAGNGATSTTATPPPAPSNFVAAIDNTCYFELADMKQVFDLVDTGASKAYTLTDFREPELWWGHKICPDAVRTGRMPHTVLLDWHDFFDEQTGLFKSMDKLQKICTNHGMRENKINVLICNKGWRTGISYFVLRYLGFPKSSIRHYVGGVREWAAMDPVQYPMETDACYHVGKNMPGSGSSGKRFSGAFAQLGNIVYCCGGYVLSNPAQVPYSIPSNKVQAYTIDAVPNDIWTDGLAAMPEALAFSIGAPDPVGQYVYVMGGLDATETITTVVYRYDPIGNTWASGFAPLPVGRFSYAGTYCNGKIYVCGGLTNKDKTVTANYSIKAYAYDVAGDTWETLPDINPGRRCHTMVTVGNLVYVLGGFYYDDVAKTGVDLKDVLVLDTTNIPAGWTQAGNLPFDIAGHVAAVCKGKIYVLGGWTVEGIKLDVMEFDPATKLSRIMKRDGRSASIGWPRYWYFIGARDDLGLIAQIGGYGGGSGNIATTPNSGSTHFNQTYVYDLNSPFDP